MTSPRPSFDFVVIGSGPAGQNAALEAARAGQRVAVVEREVGVGGSCVHRGTIPSKTLREVAAYATSLRRRARDLLDFSAFGDVPLARLLERVDDVVDAHARTMRGALEREGVVLVRGRARLLSPTAVEVVDPAGGRRELAGRHVVLAVGSRPREPAGIPVDHERIVDSDSILGLAYLPRSLAILGAGVIACEYASIFSALGVAVTLVDRGERPLGFLDPELSSRFCAAFEERKGRFLGGRSVVSVDVEDASVSVRLAGGEGVTAERLLCALGRVANLDGLGVEAAGLAPDARGLLAVDAQFRTATPSVLAVGDVIGPPALASAAIDQGSRAVRAALGLGEGPSSRVVPTGIYTIPEIACVGLTEAEATSKYGDALVGRAELDRVARGRIADIRDGLLKLVCDPGGTRLVGAQIVGEGATELIHLAQMAVATAAPPDVFVDQIWNFPTLAEAYREAALDVRARRRALDGVAA